MKIIKASLKRLFFSSKYLIHMIFAAILSVTSVKVLKIFDDAVRFFPPEVINAFKIGDNYNIGILSLRTLDITDRIFCDDIITGILSGSFSHCLLVFLITTFIGFEKKSGYLKFAIVRGENRNKLYTKYIISSVVSLLPFIVVCLLGVSLSLAINGLTEIQNINYVLMIVAIQVLMIIGIGVGVAVISVLTKNAAIICLCIVLIAPLLPSYISVFTKGKIDISNYLLLSRLIESGSMNEMDFIPTICLTLLAATLFYIIGLLWFKHKNF